MATRLFPPFYQFEDADGKPLVGGTLEFYSAGTSTPKDTYADAGLTIPNGTITLNDLGRAAVDIFAGGGDYRIILKDADGVPIGEADPVAGDSLAPTAAGASFRNVLINGDFAVNQRQATSVANDAYCMDRWYALTNTGNVTIAAQQLQALGIQNNIRLTQPDATPKRMGLAQIVEAQNCRYLRSSPAALSGWVRCSISTPIRYAILSWTGTANVVTSDVVADWTSASFAAGGFFLGSNLTVQQVGVITPTAAVWTPLPAISSTLSGSLTNSIVMVWTENVVAQNVTLSIGNMQMEAGTTASAFEHVGNSIQELRCFRYYQKSFNRVDAPAQNAGISLTNRFPQVVGATTVQYGATIKLNAPIWKETYTVTLYNPEAANALVRNQTIAADCVSSSVGSFGNSKFTIDLVTPAASAAGDGLAVHWTVDAEL